MPTYKKAPAFRGKDVVLSIGRTQIRVEDDREYTDQRFGKFVRYGFVVEVQSAPLVAPAVAEDPPSPAPSADTVEPNQGDDAVDSDQGAESDELDGEDDDGAGVDEDQSAQDGASSAVAKPRKRPKKPKK